jgi:hypothetical protein
MIHFWRFFVANSPSPGQYSVRNTTIIKSPLNGFCVMLRSTPVMGGWLLDTARTVMPLSLLSALLLWFIIWNSYSYLPVTQDGHLKTATSELRTLLNISPTGRITMLSSTPLTRWSTMWTRTKSLGTGSRVSTRTFTSSLSIRTFSALRLFTYSLVGPSTACYILEPDCSNRGNQIHDSGHQFYGGKHKKYFNNLFSSVGDWFKAMDPTNKRFGENWVRLTKDLLFDSEGSLKFKPAS